MWPWEHLAVGYLLFSMGARLLGREPPTDREAGILAVSTQLPDLVDKPLSWGLNLFPSGYAIGHSVFVAIPMGLLVYFVAKERGHPRWGVAVAIGYWSHPLADLLNSLRYGDRPLPARVLWPFGDPTPYETQLGLRRGLAYLDAFHTQLSTMDPGHVIVVYLLLPLATVAVWVLDGAPGTRGIRRWIGRS